MARGFICEDADVAGITTSYDLTKAVLLHVDTARDANSVNGALPQSGYMSNLEIVIDETVATIASVTAYLCWDSTGDDPITAQATITLHAGLTDVSLRMGAAALDKWYRAPATQTTKGKVYLFLKTNAGTGTLKKARLYWTDEG